MSILQDEPKSPPATRKGPFILVALIATVGAAAYFEMLPTDWTGWLDDPDSAKTSANPPARFTSPEPSPEPTPTAPPPGILESEPEPEPEPIAEPVSESTIPESRLEPLLRVSSDVPGASVFLDREFLGTTPFELVEVSGGPHRLNVSAEGYQGFAETIEIGDQPLSVEVRFLETRLDRRISVVHKHRFGSCRGFLRADVDGIHYETEDDDAFSIPLSEIDVHTIDYLEHTLTLKRRNGRTYNFTDEQETADALFVFHRDVEQAREQLTTGAP
ncbi:MAG: PEGA domain-containing protein [Acidobacteriota bacterium]|nr:PEGA domain-containing protein [Acidobacteriota bacterium]